MGPHNWSFHKTPEQLNLLSVPSLWREFYATEDDKYAERIHSVLIARGEIPAPKG